MKKFRFVLGAYVSVLALFAIWPRQWANFIPLWTFIPVLLGSLVLLHRQMVGSVQALFSALIVASIARILVYSIFFPPSWLIAATAFIALLLFVEIWRPKGPGSAYQVALKITRDSFDGSNVHALIDRASQTVKIRYSDGVEWFDGPVSPLGSLEFIHARDSIVRTMTTKDPDIYIPNAQTDSSGRVLNTPHAINVYSGGMVYGGNGQSGRVEGGGVVLNGNYRTGPTVIDMKGGNWQVFTHTGDASSKPVKFRLSDPADKAFARWISKNRRELLKYPRKWKG